MRRKKGQEVDRRPWAVRDTQGVCTELRSWHKANAAHLVRMLDEQYYEPGRFRLYDRIKERFAELPRKTGR